VLAGGFYADKKQSTASPSREWRHITFVYINSINSIKIYVNGKEDPSSRVDVLSETFDTVSGYPLSIGSEPVVGAQTTIDGILDDIRIYNRALSDNEVRDLYDFESQPPTSNPRVATAVAQVVNGFVVGASLTDGGRGYTNAPAVTITGGGGTGATAVATIANGAVTAITLLTTGNGYTSTPTIQIAPPPFPPRRATATSQVINGFVVGATVIDGGFGYSEPPNVLLLGGGGTGATATAVVQNGIVTGITLVQSGTGYTSAPTVKISSPPFTPSVGIRVSKVLVDLKVVQGRKYQLESSTDLQTWAPAGTPFVALDEVLEQEFDASRTGTYFRVQQVP